MLNNSNKFSRSGTIRANSPNFQSSMYNSGRNYDSGNSSKANFGRRGAKKQEEPESDSEDDDIDPRHKKMRPKVTELLMGFNRFQKKKVLNTIIEENDGQSSLFMGGLSKKDEPQMIAAAAMRSSVISLKDNFDAGSATSSRINLKNAMQFVSDIDLKAQKMQKHLPDIQMDINNQTIQSGETDNVIELLLKNSFEDKLRQIYHSRQSSMNTT